MWMSCLHCMGTVFRSITRAMARRAAATVRAAGGLTVHPHWEQRAAVCETCPLRVIHRQTSYCGRPFLEQIARTPAHDGCGCPTRAKAQDPSEHCPLDAFNRPARQKDGACNCKWCRLRVES